MAEYRRPDENWNEFQWENEIRRDERRISCYFRELPACLDLPGEEEMRALAEGALRVLRGETAAEY